MAAPAISAAIAAVLAKVEAITPTIDPAQAFRRSSETAPPSTRAGKRRFDFDMGALRDLSNEGAGTQAPGIADRLATVAITIAYPLARAEKALETTLAVDAELVLRALGRSASWAGTVVRRAQARAAIDRTDAEVLGDAGPKPGHLYLIVTCDILYRDSE